MSLFLAPQSWPFLLALVLLVAIVVVEGLALLLGFSISGWLHDFSPDLHTGEPSGIFDAWLGWLHVGKVPLLVVLAVMLTAFSMVGFLINGLAHAFFGIYLPAIVAAPLAFFGALPLVRASAAVIYRFIPADESSAEPLENLVGKIGIIINGTARVDFPAQARVKNDHGQTLYVHVEPDKDDQQFAAGDSVLLVKQISGARFQAIANPRPDLL